MYGGNEKAVHSHSGVSHLFLMSSGSPVVPTLYRTLLRLGRQLDTQPLAKALLIAQPALLFDRRSRELVRLPKLTDLSAQLLAFNRGEFYAPEHSAQAAVRRAVRTRGTRSASSGADPVDTGLMALRTMSLAMAGGAELARHAFDCGEPSAVGRVTSVRPGTTVRPGSLLLTHPVSCLKQPTLHHSVVLILAVDDDDGVMGVVINKRLDASVTLPDVQQPEDLLRALSVGAAVPETVRSALGDTLAASPIYKGGDVSEGQLLLLHEFAGLGDSTPVQGSHLYVTTNFEEVRDAQQARETLEQEAAAVAAPADPAIFPPGVLGSPAPRVKCVAGFAGWTQEQLNAELERNVWFLVEADDVAALAMMDVPRDRDAQWLRDSMWSGAMAQLGGEHVELARFPGDHELVWGQIEELWERQSAELHKRIDTLGDLSSRRKPGDE